MNTCQKCGQWYDELKPQEEPPSRMKNPYFCYSCWQRELTPEDIAANHQWAVAQLDSLNRSGRFGPIVFMIILALLCWALNGTGTYTGPSCTPHPMGGCQEW
jgi:hypothetical protein